MRLSGISRIIEAQVGVIANANRGLKNYGYPAKTEFNNYFIIHMDYYQNIDLMTKKKSNKVSLRKIFRKKNIFKNRL